MIDPAAFSRILGHYPTGVCVITSIGEGGRPIGMAVGSFTSVLLDPPLVAFFPHRRSSTWEAIRATGRFCVNVLGVCQEALYRRFAASGGDKFGGLFYRPSGLGLPILADVVAWVDCRIHSVHEAGDQFIVVGRVDSLDLEQPIQPLLFHKGGYSWLSPMAAAA